MHLCCRFERHKVRMAEARRRAVFEAEARVLASRRRLAELEGSIRAEGERMKTAAQELDNLERVRSVCYIFMPNLSCFIRLALSLYFSKA